MSKVPHIGKAKLSWQRMLPNHLTCAYEVIQHNQHLPNNRNLKTELFSGTEIVLDLEAFSRTEGVFDTLVIHFDSELGPCSNAKMHMFPFDCMKLQSVYTLPPITNTLNIYKFWWKVHNQTLDPPFNCLW